MKTASKGAYATCGRWWLLARPTLNTGCNSADVPMEWCRSSKAFLLHPAWCFKSVFPNGVMQSMEWHGWVSTLFWGDIILASFGCIFPCSAAECAVCLGRWHLGVASCFCNRCASMMYSISIILGLDRKEKNGHQCIASLCISQLPTVSPALNQGLLSIAMASTIMPVLPLVLVPANSRCLVGMRRLSHGVSSGNNADLELGTVLPTALKFEVNITLTCFFFGVLKINCLQLWYIWIELAWIN